MPAEDPTGPPANLRSCSTVARRCVVVADLQSAQLSRRKELPTPRALAALEWLDPPHPPSSAAQQSTATAGGRMRRGRPLRVSREFRTTDTCPFLLLCRRSS